MDFFLFSWQRGIEGEKKKNEWAMLKLLRKYPQYFLLE